MSGDSLTATAGSQTRNEGRGWFSRFFGKPQVAIENKPEEKPVLEGPPKPSKEEFHDPVVGEGEEGRQSPLVREVVATSSEGTAPETAQKSADAKPAPSPIPPKRALSTVRTKVTPPLVVGDLSVGLVNIAKQVIPLPGGQYDTGPLVYTLFRSDGGLLKRIYEHLAHPYVDLGEKKVEMVIGMGAYGGFLAKGIAAFLPLIGEQPVGDLPIEKDPEKGWHFASDEMAAEELKAKAVLLVVPALTPSTLSDVEACLQLLKLSKEKGGIGGNVHVLGVATPFMFNCKPEIRNGCSASLAVTHLHSTHVVMDLPLKK